MIKLATIFAVALSACAPAPTPDKPFVVVNSDAGLEEDSACGRACLRLRTLGCSEGLARLGGRACPDTCREGIADGLLPSAFPECVDRAQARADLAPCNVRCRP